MKSFRWIWVLTLLFYCSGCTAYAPGYLPGEQMPPDDSAREPSPDLSPKPEIVEVGMGIRLTLVNGETVDGTILEITDEALAFGKATNYGLEKEYYAFEDIAKIEVPHSTGLAKTTFPDCSSTTFPSKPERKNCS